MVVVSTWMVACKVGVDCKVADCNPTTLGVDPVAEDVQGGGREGLWTWGLRRCDAPSGVPAVFLPGRAGEGECDAGGLRDDVERPLRTLLPRRSEPVHTAAEAGHGT